MQKAKKQIIVIEKQRDLIYLSIVQKQNEIGFSYNQRLFLLSGSYFGYISKFKLTDAPQQFEMSQCKVSEPVKNIKKISLKDEIIRITFLAVQSKRTVEKVWAIKFSTKELAAQWNAKLDEQRFRSNTKRSKSSQKSGRKSQEKIPTFRSNLLTDHQKMNLNMNPNVQQQKINRKSSPIENEKSKVKVDPKAQLQYNFMRNQNPSPAQNPINKMVYNELYREPIQEKQQQQSRSNFQMPDKSRESQIAFKKENSKEKQKLKEMQAQRARLARVQAENNRILQENLNQFTRNSRQQKKQRGQVSNKIDQREDKNRSNDPNYYQMINKIVSESKSKQNLNKAEFNQDRDSDHLYQRQKRFNDYDDEQIRGRDGVPEYHGSHRAQESSPIKFQNLAADFDPDWTYKYLTQPHASVFDQFKKFSQDLAEELILELSSQKHKKAGQIKKKQKKYRKTQTKVKGESKIVENATQFILFETQDCQIKIALIKLKQNTFQKNSVMGQKICDNKAGKKLKNQFKNYLALYKALENSKIIVPLVSLVEYQGFTLLFKSKPRCSEKTDIWKSIPKQDLKTIQENSKISVNTLTISQTKIFPIDSEYYCKIYQAFERKSVGRLKKAQKGAQRFKKFVIQELESFLPIDLLFEDRVDQSYRLRQQLVLFENSKDSDSPQDKSQNQKYMGVRQFKGIKMDAKQKQQNKVRNLSKGLLKSISNVISALDSLQFLPLNSRELSQFMHANGVNIRYLSLIYENLSLALPKTIIAAEIVARTCKIVLNKTIQDIVYSESIVPERDSESSRQPSKLQILDDTIDFLNCIVGNTYETSALWKVLQVHSNQYFNIAFGTQDVHRGYFLLALAYHSKIRVKWGKIGFENIFKSSHCFSQENVQGISITSKTYSPIFDQKVTAVKEIITSETEQNFISLVEKLDLNRFRIPSYFFQVSLDQVFSTLGDAVKAFLSSFIHPQTVIPSNLKYTHLKLFDEERPQSQCYPKRSQLELSLREIKWYMKEKKREKYIKACDGFLRKVHKFYGDFHPLLAEIYELFSNYHMSNCELQDSITFSKSALVVIIKICGTNHLKTAQAYYHLSLCYIKAGKKQEAVSQLIKAKNIFENDSDSSNQNAKIQSFGYAVILNKLALLQLNQGNVQDTVKLALGSLAILDNIYSHGKEIATNSLVTQRNYTKRVKEANGEPEKVEDQRTQAYEILARSYELLQRRDQQMKLSNYCGQHLYQLKNPLNLQRNLKIILYPYFNSLSAEFASSYLDIISQIPMTISAATYGNAYKLLKVRIAQKSLIENFKNYLLNIPSIEQFISANEVLKNWQNFSNVFERETVNDFVCLTEELLFFLGQGFVTGAIREAL